ncbi:alpha/beta-hydrolase, partial [Polyplosphaeria fusca]
MPSTRTTLFLGALSAIAAAQKTDAPCADVVIFMARGNDAPYQPDGRTFTFVETTCAKVAPASCDYMDAVFDATLGGDYCAQLAEGARNGVRQITEFNQRCPNTQIVINGYSQGAHVMGDVLGGPGGCTGSSTGIDSNSAAGKAIAAALLWGDVKHTANQPYNTLDGAGRGPQPRTGNDLALLNRYSSVLRAYCAAGDPVCAGGNDVAQHLNYFELYTQQAADWVVSMLKKKAPLTSSSASAPPTSALPSSA